MVIPPPSLPLAIHPAPATRRDVERIPESALLACADLPTLAAEIVERARQATGGNVALLWWLNEADRGTHGCYPAHADNDASWARAGLTGDPERPTETDGSQFAAPAVAVEIALASLPMRTAGAGAVLLLDGTPVALSPAEAREWALPLGPYVDNALQRAQMTFSLERLRKSEKVQRALFAIADLASSNADMVDMLRGLHEIVAGLMYAENFFIALYHADKETIRFIHFVDVADEQWQESDMLEESLDSIRHSLTWHLIKGAKPLRGPTRDMSSQVDGPLQVIGPHSADWLGVPMVSGGQVRGAMVVQHYDAWPCYSAEDQALLSFVASHVLTALDRKQAFSELEREVDHRTRALTVEVRERERGERLQATLFRIGELAQTVTSLDQFYASVHAIVGEIIDSRNFYIALLDDSDNTLRFPYFVDDISSPPSPRKAGRGITEYVLRTGRPLLIDLTTESGRAEVDDLIMRGELAVGNGQTHSWLGVPLVCNDRTVGVLAVQTYLPGVQYSARDQELLTFISYQIANGLDRQRAAASLKTAHADLEQRVVERTRELSEQIAVREQIEQRLQHEVLHDSLTGLPNRAYLRQHIGRALGRRGRDNEHRFAILFMDLDRFKVINDSAGHLVGDALLCEVARRFAGCVRGADMVARLGGDEFAILMDDVGSDGASVRLAQRVIASLQQPIRVEGKELFTSVSVGIVLSDPRYRDADELLRDADIAMYRAKANGRRHFEVFDEHLHQQALDQLQLEGDLRQAIAQQAFAPYFQPILRLDDRGVVGYEALVRWLHPTRGWLVPGEFLPAAEAGGLLEAIDWLMYDATCRAIPGLLRDEQYVNINVSPRHLLTEHFDTRLLALLDMHGVSPSQLRIEVTEGALMENPERAGETLERLRTAGVLAALDDFGTGYSSLGYLHKFRLNTIKIDRAFIEHLVPGNGSKASSAVASAILTLSAALGLEVVAEGIENESQRSALMELGCVLGQGYLFARPQSLADSMASRDAEVPTR